MHSKICYIVGAGENYGLDFKPSDDSYVIAVDGGYSYLKEAGITPDFIIGDFDSLKEAPPKESIVLPTAKDDTDTLAAIRLGIKLGYSDFFIYCGTGGRIEHTLANIELLHYLSDNQKRGFLFDQNVVMTTVKDGSVTLKNGKGYVSVFTLTDVSQNVNLKGLKFPLVNYRMTNTFPIGISNEFTEGDAQISVEKGTLLIIYPRENTEILY
ncbi:MAG: thiamine diphosphokinase [Bacillota bacterium]|nr:thiamine diphosphokinase [Bacillota bacterium]